MVVGVGYAYNQKYQAWESSSTKGVVGLTAACGIRPHLILHWRSNVTYAPNTQRVSISRRTVFSHTIASFDRPIVVDGQPQCAQGHQVHECMNA